MECPRRTRPISWNKNKTVDWFLQFWNRKKVFPLYCCRCNKKVDALGLRKEPWIHQWQPVVANNEKNDVYSPFRYSILAAWIIIFQLDCRTEKKGCWLYLENDCTKNSKVFRLKFPFPSVLIQSLFRFRGFVKKWE